MIIAGAFPLLLWSDLEVQKSHLEFSQDNAACFSTEQRLLGSVQPASPFFFLFDISNIQYRLVQIDK